MTDQARIDAWKKLGDLCVHSAKFDSPQRQPFSQCLPGTRVHLLNTLRSTINTVNQKVIWLSGESGSGKSAVAHTLAEEFSNNKALAASFFFSRRHDIRSNANRFIPTISYQLGLFHPRAKSKIVEALVNDPALLDPDRSRDDQFSHLVLAPLRALLNGWKESEKKIIMLLDALDECEPGIGNNRLWQLVDFFVKALRSENSANLHVVVTSRPYESIQAAMGRTSSLIPLSIENYDAKGDIRLFLRSSFNRMADQSTYSTSLLWPSEIDLGLLVERVSRRFIVASTVMRMLEQKRQPERRSFLSSLLQTGQLQTIDQLYREVVMSSQQSSKAAIVVVAVLSLRQPLSILELSHLLGFNARPVLDSVAAIISIPPENSRELVSTYHTSIRDFFWDATRSKELYIDPAIIHRFLASASLKLMNGSLMKDICGFGDAHLLHAEIEEFDAKREVAISPALAYAVTHWLHHLCESSPDSRLQELLVSFAKEHLLHWIEVVSITGVLYSCGTSLFPAIARVKAWQSMPDQEEVVALLSDTYRLINEFFDCISKVALQVYHTALPLCPTNAALRKTYAQDLCNTTTTAIEGLDEVWSPVVRVIDFPGEVLCTSMDRRLAAVDKEASIEVWDSMAGVMIASQPVPEHRSFKIRCAFAQNSSCLAYYHLRDRNHAAVHIWTFSTNTVLLVDASYVQAVAVSSVGNLVGWLSYRTLGVVAKDQNSMELSLIFEITLWNADYPPSFYLGTQLFFSPSDSWIVAHFSHRVSVCDCRTGDLVWSISPESYMIIAPERVAMTSDERYIAFLAGSRKLFSPLMACNSIESIELPDSFTGQALPKYSIKVLERYFYELEDVPRWFSDAGWSSFQPTTKEATLSNLNFVFRLNSQTLEVIDPSISSPHKSDVRIKGRAAVVQGSDDNTFAMMTFEEGQGSSFHARGLQAWKPPIRIYLMNLPDFNWFLQSCRCSPDATILTHRLTHATDICRVHPFECIFSVITGNRPLGWFCFSPTSSYLVLSNAEIAIVWECPGGKEVSRIPIPVYSGSGWFILLGFAGDERLTMAGRPYAFAGGIKWVMLEMSCVYPILRRFYEGSCDINIDLQIGRGGFKQSPHLNKALIFGRDGTTNGYIYLHVEERGQLSAGSDPSFRSSASETRRYVVTRKDPVGTIYDTHTWSSYRLYPDGWLWNGPRRVTWIPHQYRPEWCEDDPFDHEGSVVRKFGDGVLILSNKRERPLILNFREHDS